MAVGAVELSVTDSKLDVRQRFAAVAAVEARRVPVLVVVLQVLRCTHSIHMTTYIATQYRYVLTDGHQ